MELCYKFKIEKLTSVQQVKYFASGYYNYFKNKNYLTIKNLIDETNYFLFLKLPTLQYLMEGFRNKIL